MLIQDIAIFGIGILVGGFILRHTESYIFAFSIIPLIYAILKFEKIKKELEVKE